MMRPTRVGTLAAAAAGLTILAGTPRTLEAQDEVNLYLSVVDLNGDPVTTLQADQVAVIEDGVRRETKELRLLDAPLRLTVLVDNSNTTTQIIEFIRRGVIAFLERLPEGAEVELVAIGGRARVVERRTTDRAAVIGAVGEIAPDRGTAHYVDGLMEALSRYEDMDDEPKHWPVLMMITANGTEGSSARDRDVERLNEGYFNLAATVHTLFLRVSPMATRDILQDDLTNVFVQNTGGIREEATLAEDILDKMTRLADAIAAKHRLQSQQYLVVYERPDGAEPKQIQLDTGGISGVQIAASGDGRIR